MKKLFTFLLITALTFFSAAVNAQNLIEDWDGNGATTDPGTGLPVTSPNVYGWSNATAAATAWKNANAGSDIRYFDTPTATVNYTYKGNPWAGRVLFTRWDGAAAINSVYAYPASLVANKTYMFTGKFVWHNNASVCNFTIGINSSASGDYGSTLSLSTVSITDLANKMKLYDDTMFFTPPTTGTYYLTVQNTAAVLGPVLDLSIVEVTTPSAEVVDFTKQYNDITLGDLTEGVTSDLTFTAGTNGVTIDWVSSNTNAVSNTGTVTRADKFDVPVIITANLSATINGQLYKSIKVFPATVLAFNTSAETLAQWDFNDTTISFVNDTVRIKDISGNGLVGSMVNEASIRSIGTTTKFNVLDLGNNKGYFDMGKEIGKALYTLSNYTVCAYFYIDPAYTELNSNGNFLWTFSNSADQNTDKNGYIIGSLKAQGLSISSNFYNIGNQAVQVGTNAPQGGWHHMAYTQEGDSGKVYIDGVIAKRGLITNKPFSALPKPGFTGTPFNWIGRSCYPTDVFLRQSLVYDFRLFSVVLSAYDMDGHLEVTNTLAALNAAYAASPINPDTDLEWEATNLTLSNLDGVTDDIYLPIEGVSNSTVKITWKSSFPELISNTGKVTRPSYINRKATLTATLIKGGKVMTKTFEATVLFDPAHNYKSDLIVRYDFSPAQVTGNTVTDVAEKNYTGTIMPGAAVRTIGTTNTYNVLDLGNTTGYFDMGADLGKAVYSLTDYTIGAYFLIDSMYSGIASPGNFLWSLSNTDKALTDKNGYVFGSLKIPEISMAPTDYNTAETVAIKDSAPNDNRWHHMAYTQAGSMGFLYIDGAAVGFNDVLTLTLASALTKDGRMGTLYNWIGRSCYAGDAYLRNTLVYDFRMYKKALDVDEINTTEMNVANTIAALNTAYIESPGGWVKAPTVKEAPYKVFAANGQIQINGLKGKERVAVYDLMGRKIHTADPANILAKPGVYIVKIDGYTKKVVVQ